MSETIVIDDIVDMILEDYDGRKNIDRIDFLERPEKAEIWSIVHKLSQLVFPGYFDDERNYKIYNPRHHFAVMTEDIFYHLKRQIYLALDYCKKRGTLSEEEREKESQRKTRLFFEKIPKIREYIETDLIATFDGDPAAGCFEEIILAYPGLFATTVYRLAHELYLLDVPVIPRLMTEYAHSQTGIDIHPGAVIGKYFFIDHGTGIVVGGTTIIGDNVKLYQGVTLGALSTRGGQKLSGVKRHPTIEDNVTIYSGATVLGGDTVLGKNAVIGGNAFITSSIPADTRVSLKNLELEYKDSSHKTVKKEIEQSEEWYYII